MLSRIARSFKKETTPTYSKNHHSTSNMTSNPSTTMFRGLPVIPDETYSTHAPRRISKLFLAAEVEEGAGMRVRRGIGLGKLRHLSPFVMLDHFNSTFGNDMDAGAPDHPHRVSSRPLTLSPVPLLTKESRDKKQYRTSSKAASTTKTSPVTEGRSKLAICNS
jgi:hypothetical protein